MSNIELRCSQARVCRNQHCSHRNLHTEEEDCTREPCPNMDTYTVCVKAEPTFLGDLVGEEED